MSTRSIVSNALLLAVMATVTFGCDQFASTDDGAGGADSGRDTSSVGSTVERRMQEVGRRLESAAAQLQSEITETRIQAVVDNLKGLEGVDVTITGPNEVTLNGTVADELTRQDAQRLVSRIKGVEAVRDSLRVGAVDTATVPSDTGD